MSKTKPDCLRYAGTSDPQDALDYWGRRLGMYQDQLARISEVQTELSHLQGAIERLTTEDGTVISTASIGSWDVASGATSMMVQQRIHQERDSINHWIRKTENYQRQCQTMLEISQ